MVVLFNVNINYQWLIANVSVNPLVAVTDV